MTTILVISAPILFFVIAEVIGERSLVLPMRCSKLQMSTIKGNTWNLLQQNERLQPNMNTKGKDDNTENKTDEY